MRKTIDNAKTVCGYRAERDSFCFPLLGGYIAPGVATRDRAPCC
jgi:hypothetical protein